MNNVPSGRHGSITVRARNLSRDLATHPAVWLGTGNPILAYTTNGFQEALPAMVGAGIIYATVTAASFKNETAKLPFFILGGLTVATGALGINSCLNEFSTSEIMAMGEDVRYSFLSSAALIGWGVGHFFSGAREAADWAVSKTSETAKGLTGAFTKAVTGAAKAGVRLLNFSPKQTNATFYAGADISVVSANPAGIHYEALVPAVAGFAKSFVPAPSSRQDCDTIAKGINWHVTPLRLLATGYFMAGLFAAVKGDYGFATASFCFAAGSANFDEDQNIALQENLGLRKPAVKTQTQETVPSPES